MPTGCESPDSIGHITSPASQPAVHTALSTAATRQHARNDLQVFIADCGQLPSRLATLMKLKAQKEEEERLKAPPAEVEVSRRSGCLCAWRHFHYLY